jgi:hypothetical protein
MTLDTVKLLENHVKEAKLREKIQAMFRGVHNSIIMYLSYLGCDKSN